MLDDVDDDETGSRKRNRIPLACDNCNRKKVRCLPAPEGHTSCANCLRLKLECSYERRSRRKTLTSEYMDTIEDRLASIESLLKSSSAKKRAASASSASGADSDHVKREGSVELSPELAAATVAAVADIAGATASMADTAASKRLRMLQSSLLMNVMSSPQSDASAKRSPDLHADGSAKQTTASPVEGTLVTEAAASKAAAGTAVNNGIVLDGSSSNSSSNSNISRSAEDPSVHSFHVSDPTLGGFGGGNGPFATMAASGGTDGLLHATPAMSHADMRQPSMGMMAHGGLHSGMPLANIPQSNALNPINQASFTTVIREDLFNLFFEFVYPIFHPLQLPDSQAYWRVRAQTSVFLTNAMYSTALRFSSFLDPRYPRHTAGDLFFFEARSLLDAELEAPTSSTVFGLILLHHYSYASARRMLGSTYFSICMKLCIELRLNLEPELKKTNCAGSPYEQEINRRLWWTFWMMENYGCALAPRRPTLQVGECLVALPRACRLSGPSSAGCSDHTKLSIKVMSSTDLFTPPLSTSTPEGYLLMLEKRLHMVIQRSPDLCCAIPSMSREDEAYNQMVLDASLRAWYDTLPERIKSSQTDTLPLDPSLPRGPTWMLVYIRVLYHFSYVLLYRPNVMHALSNPKLAAMPEFAKCHDAATACTGLMAQIVKHNPEFHHLSFFMAYVAFHVGWIHAAVGQVLSGSDLAASAVSWKSVDTHMEALRNLGRYWAMPTYQYALLWHFKQTKDSALMQLPLSRLRELNPLLICPHLQMEGFLIPQTLVARLAGTVNGNANANGSSMSAQSAASRPFVQLSGSTISVAPQMQQQQQPLQPQQQQLNQQQQKQLNQQQLNQHQMPRQPNRPQQQNMGSSFFGTMPMPASMHAPSAASAQAQAMGVAGVAGVAGQSSIADQFDLFGSGMPPAGFADLAQLAAQFAPF